MASSMLVADRNFDLYEAADGVIRAI